jgi:hypothetical protein
MRARISFWGFVSLLALNPTASAESNGVITFHSPGVWDPCAWPVPVVTYAPFYPVQPRGVVPGPRLPATYARDYAPPTPAPPSPEPIPSPPRLQPDVRESRSFPQGSRSRSYYDTYYAAANATPPEPADANACSVSFWNLSPRRISLRVNDQTYGIERGRQLNLALPRQFRWQMENREPEAMQIADGQAALEVVIRR